MDEQQPKTEMLRALRTSYDFMLKDFVASSSSFKVVHTVPTASATQLSETKTLYVLDASFNPPTKAHSYIVKSAIKDDVGPQPKRILLLLATLNADKEAKPAALQDRLVMMTLLAHKLRGELQHCNAAMSPTVDIGIIKQPFFHNKATALEESNFYPNQPEQVHLIGFDTLIRIFDPKYYPSERGLRVLAPFLGRHRLRTLLRVGDQWGSHEDQKQYVNDIALGKKVSKGGEPEWAQRITLVEAEEKEIAAMSSTLARSAVEQNRDELGRYVDRGVEDWITSEDLYSEGKTQGWKVVAG